MKLILEPCYLMEMTHACLKNELFYLRSCGGQWFLLLALDYAAGILLRLVYLQEALDHLHSRRLS